MVSPVLTVAVPLAAAFLVSPVSKLGERAARALHLGAAAFVLACAASWAFVLHAGGAPVSVITGGWPSPLGIELRMGFGEAVLLTVAALAALGSAALLARKGGVRSIALQLVVLAGAAGLIMTRDLFNLFVFLEIASIGTFALAAMGDEERGLEAGFKYAFMSAIASAFLLVGIAFVYRTTGTLSIDEIALLSPAGAPVAATIFLFIVAGFVAELKLFPLNGPGVDLYEGVEPGVMALLTGTTLTATVFAFWKLLPLASSDSLHTAIVALGGVTFLLANLFAARQSNVRRMLGYSTSAQMGLVAMLAPLAARGGVPATAPALLLINHSLAKAGLLWLVAGRGEDRLEGWKGSASRSALGGVAMVALVLAIVGLPPFPGFWGKWQALVALARGPYVWWIAPVLVGSLIEFVYYFRWLGRARATDAGASTMSMGASAWSAIVALAALAIGLAVTAGSIVFPPVVVFLASMGLLLIVFAGVQERVLAWFALLALIVAGYALYSGGRLAPGSLDGLFGAVVLGGALLSAVAALGARSERASYHGVFLILTASLLAVVHARSLVTFFVAWEVMTWTSYLIVGGSRTGERAAYRYVLFSGAAGFMVLGGVVLAAGLGVDTLAGLTILSGSLGTTVAVLLAGGFAVKAASIGAHVWAPAAYSESPDVFTPFFSGVVSKMPVLGLIIVGARLGGPAMAKLWGAFELGHLLAWVGAATAFGMTLLAAFQEDAKKLLAYSSVGQVGYIVVGLAVLTPLGWSAALYHTVHHLLFKALLFLAVAGVIHRTGTRTMREMGGLIKKMPISFISVLIGIIALSGVPPLSGFAGKWLLYNALLERGWLLVAGLSMFASVVAFLYCFRLIHTIFLGQLKRRHRDVREAPLPFVIPQAALMIAIMGLSMFPDRLLRPVQSIVSGVFGSEGVVFAGNGLMTAGLGHLNPLAIMMMVMVLFGFFFLVLFFVGATTKKVGQLDIVFSGEVPPPPEELHYASDFFRPYERAFEPVLRVSFTRLWRRAARGAAWAADAGRRMYSGDAQTYIVYALVLLAVLALAIAGE